MTAAVAISGGLRLPQVVPIFPLPGVLLLPRGQLPLHVFEPRYRAMTRDALGGDRVIAMAQPCGNGAGGDDGPVYPMACLGTITAWKATEDGRYFLNLTGLCRFRIAAELPPCDGYRRVVADYAAFETDLVEDCATPIDRARLEAALCRYLQAHGMGAEWDALAEMRPEPLVTALAMLCPFTVGEKQALLECMDLGRRAEVLTSLLEMACLSPSPAREPVTH